MSIGPWGGVWTLDEERQNASYGIMIEISETSAPHPPRDVATAVKRGLRQTCPACGRGRLYRSYLKVADNCGACHEELHHQRADDAPPYFTMLITGHVVVAGVVALEEAFSPPSWVHAAVWGPVLIALSLWLLPRVKGALVGVQWALRMHGFGGESEDGELPAAPTGGS